MLIKGSASRLPAHPGRPTGRNRMALPERGRQQKSPARGKRPLRAPVRHAFFRCVARTFSALRILFSAAKGCAPPVRPAVLPGISPNIADPPEKRRAASKLKGSTWPARVRHQIDVEPSCSPCRSDARPLIRPPPGKQRKPCPAFCIRADADSAVNGSIAPRNAPRVQQA